MRTLNLRLRARARRLGGIAANTFSLGAVAAEIILRARLFGPTLIKIMADFLAFVADKIEAVDTFINFFPIQNSALQFLDADAQQFLIALFNFPASGFVTWQIFIIYFV